MCKRLSRVLYNFVARIILLPAFLVFGLCVASPAIATDPADFGWKSLGLNQGVFSLAIDPNDPNVIYAGTSNSGLYRSIDAGHTWTHLWGETGSQVRSIVIGKESKTIFIGVALGPEPGIWTSEDNGANWRKIDTGLGVRYIQTLVMHPTDEQVLYAGTGWGVVRTEDGGQTWTHASEGLAGETGDYPWVHEIVIDPSNPEIIYALTSTAMLYRPVPASKDLPQELNQSGPPIHYLISADVKPNVYKTLNGGDSWFPLETDIDITNTNPITLKIDPNVSNTFYLGTGIGLYKTTNNGQTFMPLSSEFSRRGIVSKIQIDRMDPKTVFVSTFFKGLFSSDDEGMSWKQIFSFDSLSNSIATFEWYSDTTSNTIYVAGHTATDVYIKTIHSENMPEDFNDDNVINFDDFLLFAQYFNQTVNGFMIESRFDLNQNNRIDFPDFLIFVQNYSQ